MQVLGVFGFEVLDEGLLSLSRQLGGAPIRFPLEPFLALLFVFLGVLVHVSCRTLGHSVHEHPNSADTSSVRGLGSEGSLVGGDWRSLGGTGCH